VRRRRTAPQESAGFFTEPAVTQMDVAQEPVARPSQPAQPFATGGLIPSGVAHPCAGCGRFAFPQAGVRCFWCRGRAQLDARSEVDAAPSAS
jgi:hypothetical protein